MSSEKTEEPTPQKLRQLRDRGDIPLSRTLMNDGALLGAAAGVGATASTSGAVLAEYARWCFSLEPEAGEAIVVAVRIVAALAGPVLLGGAVGGAMAGVVQTGGLFAPSRLAPDGERLQPGRVWQSQFSKEALVSAAITGLAAVVGTVATWGFIRRWTEVAPAMLQAEGVVASDVIAASLDAVYGASLALLGMATLHAVIDFAWQRKAFLERNRMSLQEIRDEYKSSEGDPQHKARRERAHRELLTVGIRAGVARSDVILRNPTHVAVGLRYRPEEGDFPTVTIGGRGHAARQILREARRKGIPEFTDRKTARATVELEPGDPVPEELFEPVAIVFRWLREQK